MNTEKSRTSILIFIAEWLHWAIAFGLYNFKAVLPGCLSASMPSTKKNLKELFCRNVNWYSVKEQVKSVAKIKDKGFLRILPGHGRPGIFESDEERQDQLGQLLAAEGFKP